MDLIDTIYGICDIYREEYQRRRDYLILCKRVRDLKYDIKKKYPTKRRAIYETYILFDELKGNFHNQIKVFKFKEFRDLYTFEEQTYKYIDAVYGR